MHQNVAFPEKNSNIFWGVCPHHIAAILKFSRFQSSVTRVGVLINTLIITVLHRRLLVT